MNIWLLFGMSPMSYLSHDEVSELSCVGAMVGSGIGFEHVLECVVPYSEEDMVL